MQRKPSKCCPCRKKKGVDLTKHTDNFFADKRRVRLPAQSLQNMLRLSVGVSGKVDAACRYHRSICRALFGRA